MYEKLNLASHFRNLGCGVGPAASVEGKRREWGRVTSDHHIASGSTELGSCPS